MDKKMKKCIACGMSMKKPEDFAMNDESKDYCARCSHPDGSMKYFDEQEEGMTYFFIKTQGLDRETAEGAALSMMKKLPARKDNFA